MPVHAATKALADITAYQVFMLVLSIFALSLVGATY